MSGNPLLSEQPVGAALSAPAYWLRATGLALLTAVVVFAVSAAWREAPVAERRLEYAGLVAALIMLDALIKFFYGRTRSEGVRAGLNVGLPVTAITVLLLVAVVARLFVAPPG